MEHGKRKSHLMLRIKKTQRNLNASDQIFNFFGFAGTEYKYVIWKCRLSPSTRKAIFFTIITGIQYSSKHCANVAFMS